MNKTIYFITGPTGIGKSEFTINLSKQINGEIINADSIQIYKELNIISARPTSQDIKKDLSASLKFKKEKFIDNLNLATREDLHILKKLLEKQQKEINILKKNKKKNSKKGKKS